MSEARSSTTEPIEPGDRSSSTQTENRLAGPAFEPSPSSTGRTSRRRRRVPLAIRLLQVVLVLVVIGLWEGLGRAGIIDPFFFSRPGDIGRQVVEWVRTGSILPHLQVTLTEALLALVIGMALGLVVGFVLARVRFLALLLDPFIKVLNALPRVVLAPLFLLWFGLGIWSKVAFGVTLVFFIVFFNTYQGIREVDPVLVSNARMLRATEPQLVRHVFLPSALTWIFSSLHVSVGFSIVGAVVGEYLGSSSGVGYIIAQAEGTFDTTGVFAGMVVLSVVVVLIDVLVGVIERYLLRWKPEAAARV